jgi:hypothetical protein
MTAQLAPTPVFKAFDSNGAPLMGGLLWTYAAGTTTLQATYVDSTQTTPNTNPIVLNLRGECNLWLNPSQNYKFMLTDSLGNQIWTVDNIVGSATANLILGPPITGASLTANVLDATTGVIFNDLSPVTGFDLAFQNGGVNQGLIGTGSYTVFGSLINDFSVVATTARLRLVSASGVLLTTSTTSSAPAMTILGNAQLSQSFGLAVQAGTNTNDTCFSFANHSDTQNFLAGLGDGEVFVGEPPAAQTPPPGTHQVGYLDLPGNTQNGNYTLAATDRGKIIKRSGGTGPFTYTIPANGVVPLPVDMVVQVFGAPGVSGATLIAPGAGVTLTFYPSISTGTRTGAAAGFNATLYQAFPNTWYIWGNGLT